MNHLEDTFVSQDSRITTLETASGGGAVQLSTAQAKGDLLVATGPNAFTRLGVGGNGQVLTADATVLTTGVKWATPASGGTSLTVQDEGSALTQRSILNFVGAGVTAADDGTSKTVITIPGGSGTPADATTTAKGVVQLAGHLSGTAAAPTVTDNTSNQKVQVAQAGSVIGTRRQVNLIQGANVTLTTTDNAGSDRVDVTIAAATSGSAGIPASTVTTKGDLIAATGNAAVARLAAGADGQSLTADSTQTTGLRWAPPPVYAPCRLATTAAITRSGTGQLLEGFTVGAGDRILDRSDATGANHGIYVASSGTWARAVDMAANTTFLSGALVEVLLGSVNGGVVYALSNGSTATGQVSVDPMTCTPVTRKVLSAGATQLLRAGLNFTGAGVTVTDDAANNKTDITIAGASGGSIGVEHNGSLIGTRPKLNLIDGSNITLTVADNAAASQVDVTVASVPQVVTPTFGATVNTDASLGDHFRFTATSAFTLADPTNAVDGQRITWEIVQDGTGSRAMTLGFSFALGTTIPSAALSTTANKRDFLTAVYNATTTTFYVTQFVKGF